MDFWKAAFVRALKTFCQSMLSMIAVGASFSQVDWIQALSVSGVAFLLSILTSVVGGLPEAKFPKGDHEEK